MKRKPREKRRIAIPQEHHSILLNLRKSIEAMGMATDYLVATQRMIAELGAKRQQELDQQGRLAQKVAKNIEKKK